MLFEFDTMHVPSPKGKKKVAIYGIWIPNTTGDESATANRRAQQTGEEAQGAPDTPFIHNTTTSGGWIACCHAF